MTQFHRQSSSLSRNERLLLAFIVSVNFFLVWYRFDFPGYDDIELLHAIEALTPLSYIIKWTMTVEVHPPTFYIFLKIARAFCDSDFFIKSACSCFIFVLMYYCYRIGELFSKEAGILSVCLISINPIIVHASRSLRPHIIVYSLLAAAIYYCLKNIDNSTSQLRTKLIISNIIGLSFHYMFLLYIVTQSLIFIFFIKHKNLKEKLFYSAAIPLISFLPISPFYLSSVKSNANMTLSNMDYLSVVDKICLAYSDIAGSIFFNQLYSAKTHGIMLVILVVILFLFIVKCKHSIAVPVVILFIAPFCILLIARHGFVMYKYIPQTLMASTLMASFLLAIPLKNKLGITVFLISTVAISLFLKSNTDFVNYWNELAYKKEAPYLTQALNANSFVSFHDECSMEAYNYYYKKHIINNYILDRKILQNQDNVDFMLVGETFYSQSLTELIKTLHKPASTIHAPVLINTWNITRAPAYTIQSIPAKSTLTTKPLDFLKHVFKANDVMFCSYFGDGIAPTKIGYPGSFELMYKIETAEQAKFVAITLDYDNKGDGNTLSVQAKFDDEPETLAFCSGGIADIGRVFIPLSRKAPFTTLNLKFNMTIVPITPKYPNWNHGQTRVKNVIVGFYGNNEPGNGFPESYNKQFFESSYTDNMSLLAPVTINKYSLKGVAKHQAGNTNIVFSPTSEGDGEIIVTCSNLPTSRFNLIIFPRVSGKSSVKMYELNNDTQEFLFQMHGIDNMWSSQNDGFPVLVQGNKKTERTFKICLSGPGSQIWQRGDSLLNIMKH